MVIQNFVDFPISFFMLSFILERYDCVMVTCRHSNRVGDHHQRFSLNIKKKKHTILFYFQFLIDSKRKNEFLKSLKWQK